jgi:hypothetical protein
VFHFIVFDINSVVNNIKPLTVAMETQESFTFALLWSHKIFYTALKYMNVLRPSCKILDIFFILTTLGVY